MKYRMEEERENVRREGNEEEKGKEGRRDNEKKTAPTACNLKERFMIISRRTKYNPCTACLSENSESWLSRLSLFSNYIEMYSCLNLLVEAQGGGVLAEGLGISHLDELSLYLEASLCQLIGDGGSI